MGAVVAPVDTKLFFLVGFMGVGKSTLGRAVAAKLGLAFIDLDERIERATGSSVAEIFVREGERGFRRRESEALASLIAERTPGVVAAGGGAFTVESNRRLMKTEGIVVWLDVPIECLLGRIEASSRPLWNDEDGVRRLHAERREFYRLADHRLELADVSIAEGTERLYRLLASYCENS